MIPRTRTAHRDWIAILVGVFLLTSPTAASITHPELYLSRAVEFQGANGRLVRLDGSFPWNALLQSGYPVQVVIWNDVNGSDFVRFDLSGNAFTGVAAAVESGLTPAEATALLPVGVPVGESNSELRLVYVGPGRIEALLSGPFATAPLAAQLFVVDGTKTFVSNPISVSPVSP
jgi:hypothetical protein